MKKVLLVLVAVASFVSANAQKVSPVVQAGYTNSILSSDGESEGLKAKHGFYIGAGYELNTESSLYLKQTLVFSTGGATSKNSDNYDEYDSKSEIIYNTLGLETLVGVKINGGVNLFTGLKTDFAVANKGKYTETYRGETYTETEDLDEFLKSAIPFIIPIGVNVAINDNLSIEAKYNFGISNLAVYDDEETAKASSLQIGAVLKF